MIGSLNKLGRGFDNVKMSIVVVGRGTDFNHRHN